MLPSFAVFVSVRESAGVTLVLTKVSVGVLPGEVRQFTHICNRRNASLGILHDEGRMRRSVFHFGTKVTRVGSVV